MALTINDLLPSGQTPMSVMHHDTVEAALERMRLHDYSQLPIVDSGQRCRGEVVTYGGIIQAIVSLDTKAGALSVRDVATQAKVYQVDEDLLAALDDIQRHDFALIVDESEVLIGIVSTYDTTAFFRHYAQDLMLIEGIETSVKDAIDILYEGDASALATAIESVTDRAADIRKRVPAAIRAYLSKMGIPAPPKPSNEQEALKDAEDRLALPKAGKAIERLSFDEFISLLLRHPKAPKLAGGKDTTEVRKMLEQVRDSRNKLAHFRGDLTAAERTHIKYAANWLERNLPQRAIKPSAINPPTAAAVAKPTIGAASSLERPTNAAGESGKESDVASAGEDTAPAGTYAALSSYLAAVPKETESVTLKFSQIEEILKKPLPRSAFEYRAWWANDEDHPQAAAWLNQSWKSQAVSMGEARLSFVRTNSRQEDYISFFSRIRAKLKEFKEVPLRASGPQGTNWEPLVYLDSTGAAQIIAVFGRRRTFRIELYLDDGAIESTKALFHKLYGRRTEIESELGYSLDWQPLEGRRACRIMVARDGRIPSDVANEALHQWAAQTTADFYKVFEPILREFRKDDQPK